MFSLRIPFIILTCVIITGCGNSNKRVAVSGTVTFQGAPLDTGSIAFLTDEGQVGGAVIKDGKFQVAAEQGLEPGTYKVTISSPKGVGTRTPEQIAAGASTPAKETIPEEYNAKTKLMIEVKAKGENIFSFTIE